jgi:hypothetical protein
MAQYRQELPKTIPVTCTDKDETVDAEIYGYQENKFLDVIINTVRIRLVHQGKFYVGNMAGYEFTAKAPEITLFKQHR